MMANFCTNCGKSVGDDAKFCQGCGTSVPAASQPAKSTAATGNFTAEDIKILCPKCKSEVPSNAKKCAHCQADLRPWPRRHPILTIFLGLTLLSIIAAASASPSDNTATKNTPAPTTQATPPLINATVTYNTAGVHVTSGEAAAIGNCKLTINGKYEAGQYGFMPGKEGVIPFSDFTDNKSARFNIFSTKPQDIHIKCSEPSYTDNVWSFN